MCPRFITFLLLGSLLAALSAGCSGNVPRKYDGSENAADGPGGRAGEFSSERAWRHLQWLVSVGPRPVGSEASEKARGYIEKELEAIGLGVTRHSTEIRFEDDGLAPLELVNLEAEIAGASSDEIVLAAPYDSAYRETFSYLGVNDGASGAAVLLEAARVLVADPLPYTVRLLFLDGEAPLGRGAPDDQEARFLGSTAAAGRMKGERGFRRVRLLILINRVSDADLRVARDRFSQRTYRDIVWEAAADLGHDDVFAPGDEFDAPAAGHRSFINHGMRRVVSIVDPVLGAGDVPDAAEFTADDQLERSSEQSLAVVGEVLLASLDRISARLVKIDRFSEVPEPEEPPVAEEPAEAAATGDASEATAAAESGAPDSDAGDDTAGATP